MTDLQGYLPESLINEVVYEAQRDILYKAFTYLKSQNFIKEVSKRLSNIIYLEGDIIYDHEYPSDKLFVLLDGKLHVLGYD